MILGRKRVRRSGRGLCPSMPPPYILHWHGHWPARLRCIWKQFTQSTSSSFTEFPIPSFIEVFRLNFWDSPGLWAPTAASYCPNRAGELQKQNMTKSHERWDGKLGRDLDKGGISWRRRIPQSCNWTKISLPSFRMQFWQFTKFPSQFSSQRGKLESSPILNTHERAPIFRLSLQANPLTNPCSSSQRWSWAKVKILI